MPQVICVSAVGPALATDNPGMAASYNNFGCSAGNRLTGESGTSQESPHVAGLGALLVAEQGHGRPAQIKEAILNSTIDLGQPGTNPSYGRGLINVAKALGL